uniref:Claudin 14a n=1 Tax=Takifugu rubripes TaxID=31033 RepID=Q6E5T8_TAKRU|nr:claudin 14a [Takifugu rubripes]|eukprot:XP_003962084.1 PREDICTED: claudin-14 [Takifugu rubripes]
MASTAVQFLGFFLGILGCAGAIAAALLPYRRSTAYVGANFITASSSMMGLWRPVWNSTSLSIVGLHGALLHGLGPTLRGIRSRCFARGSSVKSLLVLCGATCFLCTGMLCPVTVAGTTKDIIALRKHFPHGVIKYEMGPALCLGYMSAHLSLMGGLEQQKWQVTRPHPQAIVIFKYTYSRSPPYKPAEALRDNHAPSLCSFSRSSFRLTEYF